MTMPYSIFCVSLFILLSPCIVFMIKFRIITNLIVKLLIAFCTKMKCFFVIVLRKFCNVFVFTIIIFLNVHFYTVNVYCFWHISILNLKMKMKKNLFFFFLQVIIYGRYRNGNKLKFKIIHRRTRTKFDLWWWNISKRYWFSLCWKDNSK